MYRSQSRFIGARRHVEQLQALTPGCLASLVANTARYKGGPWAHISSDPFRCLGFGAKLPLGAKAISSAMLLLRLLSISISPIATSFVVLQAFSGSDVVVDKGLVDPPLPSYAPAWPLDLLPYRAQGHGTQAGEALWSTGQCLDCPGSSDTRRSYNSSQRARRPAKIVL